MQIRLVFTCFAWSLLTFLSACSHKSLQPAEYAKWFQRSENGLKVSKTNGNAVFTAAYVPWTLSALQELRGGSLNKAALDEEKKGMEELQFFRLELKHSDGKSDILKDGIQDQQEYYDRIQYLFSHIQSDLTLKDGNELLPCKLCLFERDYNVSGVQKLMLAFPLTAEEQKNRLQGNDALTTDKVLMLNDQMFSKSKFEFSFPQRTLRAIPELLIK